MQIDKLRHLTTSSTGLDKLLTTQEDVAKMQAELETMKPMLEEATRDTEATMIQVMRGHA